MLAAGTTRGNVPPWRRLPTGVVSVPALQLPQPRPAARRRGAGRGRLRQRRTDRRGAPALRPTGERWRSASTCACRGATGARTSSPGWTPGCPRRALGRGRRPGPGPPPALAAAGRRRPDARPQRPPGRRGPTGRPVRGDAGRRRPVLRVAGQRLRARRPQARPAARQHRRVRRRQGRATRAHTGGAGRPWGSTCGPARSARWCGPPASGRTSRGSTCRSSTTAAGCGTTGGVTRWPGLYVLGLPMLRRRRSTYIDGARGDASRPLPTHLGGGPARQEAS